MHGETVKFVFNDLINERGLLLTSNLF